MTEALSHWIEKSQQFNFQSLRISFQKAGEGPNLLIIHGFPTSGFDFAPMWSGSNERFNCLLPDLIGMGQTDKPDQPISIMLQADMLEALCADQGWTEAHILAHDLGDTVAQELLARAGHSKINWLSCVFLNGGIFPEMHQPILIQKLLLSPLGKWVAMLSNEATFQKSLRRIFSINHPPTGDFLRDSWLLFSQKNGKKALPRLIRYMAERKVHRGRWVGILRTTEVPITLINGSLDPISGRHAADYFEQTISNSRVVHLSNLGHYPHVEDPKAVLTEFFAFHDELLT